jgi:hypothetical protein
MKNLVYALFCMGIVLFHPLHSGAGLHSDQMEYDSLLNDVNRELQNAGESRSCPGMKIVLSCGDGICQKEKGETESSCPLDCIDAFVKSYNSQTFCRDIKEVAFPASPQDVQALVKRAVSEGKKVRAIGKAHSSNGIICSDGLVMTMENMSRIFGIERTPDGKEVVRVEPGVQMGELTEWLHQRYRSIGVAMGGFRGLTVGGSIATGVHGSSMRNTAVISSLVESVTFVNARGELQELNSRTSDPQTFKAFTANLGMLGIAVQFKLRIQPQFNLRIHSSYSEDYVLFGKKGLEDQMKACDYGVISWYPHSRKLMKICGLRTAQKEEPGAQNVLLNPYAPAFIIDPYKMVLHYGACSNTLNCMLEDLRYLSLKLFPPFEKTNVLGLSSYTGDVVGPSHHLITSNLTRNQKDVLETDWEIAVPLSQAQHALEYLQKYFTQNKICLPLLGVLIRFAPADDASLLAHTVSKEGFRKGEPAVLFEIPTYQPTGFEGENLAQYQRQYEEFAKALIRDFNGRAHWGKNAEPIFEYQRQFKRYGENAVVFEKIRDQLDPNRVFSNAFAELIKP